MIATLAIFGLVIDNAVFDFHLPDAEITLEVRAVVLRVPQANLVPGGVTEPRAAAYQAAPTRSASTTRQRMASFQRGAQEGRAALHGDESSGTESEGDA